jgi:formylmethanofuran dehydrogenase subunit E
MNTILKIVIQTGLTLWDTYQARKARQKAFEQNPRSVVMIQCQRCGEDVKADELSMSEHQRTCRPKV